MMMITIVMMMMMMMMIMMMMMMMMMMMVIMNMIMIMIMIMIIMWPCTINNIRNADIVSRKETVHIRVDCTVQLYAFQFSNSAGSLTHIFT